MSSHKVLILKKSNNTKVPDDIYAGSNRKIGASLTPSGEIGTGLTNEQRDKWLPQLVGISVNSQDYYKRVRDYYANLSILVPAELEIGMDDKDEPMVLLDYLKYKFAKINKAVASNKAEAAKSASSEVLYYFHDEAGEKVKAHSALKKEQNAYKEYIKISENPEKIEIVLQAMGVDTRQLSTADMDMVLDKMVKNKPSEVVAILKDKNLDNKAFLSKCITLEILRKVGSSILDGDEILGHTTEEAVIYLNDKANSELLTTLKARMKAFGK